MRAQPGAAKDPLPDRETLDFVSQYRDLSGKVGTKDRLARRGDPEHQPPGQGQNARKGRGAQTPVGGRHGGGPDPHENLARSRLRLRNIGHGDDRRRAVAFVDSGLHGGRSGFAGSE